MRPHVLLDVDGVLADFVQAALNVLLAETGVAVNPSTITTWELFDSVPNEYRGWKGEVYSRLADRGGCLGIPVYPGAQEGVARLREIADVTIVTSPFEGSPTWMHERERWLAHHFGIDRKHVIHATEKHRVHGDVFIDDKLAHLHAWSAHWSRLGFECHAVLWETPRVSTYPQEIASVKRAKHWGDVCAIVDRVARCDEELSR
jgi:5'(3')-deoxyribonucleotidase